MSEEPKINLAAIRRLALKEFKYARDYIQKHPGKELMPSLLVVVSDNLFDETKWQYHKVLMPIFDENRYRLLEMTAQEYARRDEYLVAVILSSETWVSTVEGEAYDAHPENRIEPRLDPDHTEALMVMAMTLDQQDVIVRAPFQRVAGGKPIFGEMQIGWDGSVKYENRILQRFMAAYCKAIVEKRGLRPR